MSDSQNQAAPVSQKSGISMTVGFAAMLFAAALTALNFWLGLLGPTVGVGVLSWFCLAAVYMIKGKNGAFGFVTVLMAFLGPVAQHLLLH
ncbi:hypothetical protein [Ralstonia pseudosolanacearum]|uniref:hypothetical protein n=1 Tax=Ralstonia pseudosolanacearum TaxID=1310165 RepID=UPI003CF92160